MLSFDFHIQYEYEWRQGKWVMYACTSAAWSKNYMSEVVILSIELYEYTIAR